MSEISDVFPLAEKLEESHLPSTDVREAVPDFDESIDFRDYVDVVLRRKWVVLGFLTVVFVSTLIILLSMTPLYQSTVKLELLNTQSKVTKFEDVMAADLQSREYIYAPRWSC